MKGTTAWVPVFRDGTFTFEVELPVLVGQAGEAFVTLETALRWERLQERVAMTIQQSSRLSMKRRSWFRTDGSAVAAEATDSSLGTIVPPMVQVA